MNENEENNKEEIKEELNLKQETVNTINDVKEQMKNINIKEEAKAGKGLLKDLWKNPVKTIKEIADDKENKSFKIALLLIIVWAVIELVDQIMYYVTSRYADFEFLPTLKVTVAPILRVLAMTVALYLVNNRAKTSISKVLTSVSIAYIPSIISSILWLLYHLSTRITTLLSPISGLLRVISIVLMYFTIKEFTNKNDEESALKEFVKVEAVFYIIVFAISFLGISL